MPIVHLSGQTIPNIGLNATGGPFNFNECVIPLTVIKYSIADAIVSVECEVADTSDYTLNMAYFYVLPVVRSIVNCAAFAVAIGSTVIVDTVVMPSGEKRPIGYADPLLKGICTLSPLEIAQANNNERIVFKHLHDLVETLIDPFEAPVNCARAVEGFAQLLLPGAKAGRLWRRMQEALNLEESYITPITEESKGPRHGTNAAQLFGTLFDLRKRSWVIATRFLEFRKRGNVNLSEPDFPRLT